MQRRHPVEVCFVGVRARFQEHLHHGYVSADHSRVERGAAEAARGGVKIDAVLVSVLDNDADGGV